MDNSRNFAIKMSSKNEDIIEVGHEFKGDWFKM